MNDTSTSNSRRESTLTSLLSVVYLVVSKTQTKPTVKFNINTQTERTRSKVTIKALDILNCMFWFLNLLICVHDVLLRVHLIRTPG